VAVENDARTRHYGHFYGLTDPDDTGPVCVVIGNCQAESLRIVLGSDALTTVRMPPVHELTAADMPHLERWLERADVVISQPIRDDYHGLALGHRQTAAHAGRARSVLVPVIRYAGLYPWHVIVRPPADASLVPPLVEYHDLRTVALAAGLRTRPLTSALVRQVSEHSLEQLTVRESHYDTIRVSPLFRQPTFDLMRTINHPGNAVWAALAAEVFDVLHLDAEPQDPGRPLLDAVHAPRDPVVIATWGLDEPATESWVVDGRSVAADDVERAHLEWYRARPDVVEAALTRHRDLAGILLA
jgi:hypothetical protein